MITMRSGALAVLFAALMGFTGAHAQIGDHARTVGNAEIATDVSAQRRPRRARLRIDVRPARPMYRDCVAWLVVEPRPSGPVIVPRERCRWVRG
jgi:hypothetical protein